MRRRDFLRGVGGCALALSIDPVAAAAAATARGDGGRVLLLVELNGGNDGLNTVVPFADERYFGARPTLAVPKDRVVRLTAEAGLHPGLRPLASSFERGDLAVVQSVGYPGPDRSHFRSMDIWHSAVPDRVDTTSGWIGRAVARAASAKAPRSPALLHLGGGARPLAFVGSPTPITSLSSLEDLELAGGSKQREVVRRGAAGRAGESDADYLATVARATLGMEKRLQTLASAASGDAGYPATPFARHLRLAATLIKAGMGDAVYFTRLSGFDTHAQQPGSHPALMRVLGGALGALDADLTASRAWDGVTVLVFSEFGRRVRENASRGTDHGVAGPVLLLGPHVRGGVHGDSPDLDDLDDGDIKHRVDLRSVYDQVLAGGLGLPAEGHVEASPAPTLFTG